MAEITVGKLAESVGITEDRLLQQMAEAGLSQTSADDTVNDEEKRTLLAFLKSSHGEEPVQETKKITLKRKKSLVWSFKSITRAKNLFRSIYMHLKSASR